MMKKIGPTVAAALLAACAYTPTEIRARPADLTATLPSDPKTAAICVRDRFEDQSTIWSRSPPVEVREGAGGRYEFVIRGGEIVQALGDFTPAAAGTSVAWRLAPTNLAGAGSTERFAEAVARCGGR